MTLRMTLRYWVRVLESMKFVKGKYVNSIEEFSAAQTNDDFKEQNTYKYNTGRVFLIQEMTVRPIKS